MNSSTATPARIAVHHQPLPVDHPQSQETIQNTEYIKRPPPPLETPHLPHPILNFHHPPSYSYFRPLSSSRSTSIHSNQPHLNPQVDLARQEKPQPNQ
ncbi:hypothetical protein MJO28_000892 [Puccinia striiformis f. sp. tritici]|uniref:Uncharacterized protein n=1 Tax=Puccinia striiformis f. sp. tritici TaxID=168172 RepID=A0ACC0F1W5_9BASI|nr:hypothetical protein Pst134EA_000355 [Puccinia striiformis f. sp. tritici]KAI9601401.1 hypothetical protein H4Q26_001219 [Puccinia striiformis f. sp. tritici PST-130]KAH9466524.1 hypothetical protein Pst134EB_001577 [Puccinia striiformis f. sp. tritici]KAH9473281.1 hypothetical protein Pst134EA_000355 [Puccinia striiformis f. sp. tritici]KAI7962798.1 hypothetical protein MJO28_000892 [Puccinia striiformis f. sp. tritici]KAI7967089.1 hypothetical protein MJO29_000366 [Puccinia striiformis f.